MVVFSPLFPESSDVSRVYTIRTEDLKAQWLKILNIDISNEVKESETIDLYKCNKSGLLFYHPITLAGSDKLYEKLQNNFDWYYMPAKWEHVMASHDIKVGESILEVGCGQGAFVKRMLDSGFSIEGIEMNSQAIEYAKNHDIPVSEKSLQELLVDSSEKFDVVCAFQVLEHVPNPLDFLLDLLKLIKPGGQLILSVPNQDSFIQYDDFDLLNMPPHHVTRWSISVFDNLSKIMPMQLERYSFEPLADYHVDWYLSVQSKRFSKYSFQGFIFRILRSYLSKFVKRLTFVRKKIPGHTLYILMRKT